LILVRIGVVKEEEEGCDRRWIEKVEVIEMIDHHRLCLSDLEKGWEQIRSTCPESGVDDE
jgi:hypothetical protein